MLDRKKFENVYWKMCEVKGLTEGLLFKLEPHKDSRESVNKLYDAVVKAFDEFVADFDFVEGVYKESKKGGGNEKHNKNKA